MWAVRRGKSVLMRTVIGLLPKREGTIEVLGVDHDKASEDELRAMERRWGILFQQGALFSSLTALQNVQFPMREYLHISKSLWTRWRTPSWRWSADARRRSEISRGAFRRHDEARGFGARARPRSRIVFLDEPTSGLDPIAAAEFDALIRTLQSTLGLTVFMVTHDLESLYLVCDRVAALADGKVVAEGPIASMLLSDHPWVRSYFGGERGKGLAQVAHAEIRG